MLETLLVILLILWLLGAVSIGGNAIHLLLVVFLVVLIVRLVKGSI